jgi:hypothetical protein
MAQMQWDEATSAHQVEQSGNLDSLVRSWSHGEAFLPPFDLTIEARWGSISELLLVVSYRSLIQRQTVLCLAKSFLLASSYIWASRRYSCLSLILSQLA